MSLPCPHCHKALTVEDLVVSGYTAVTKVQTCGKLIVKRKGRVAATTVEAHEGLKIDGALGAIKGVQTGGVVTLGAKSEWRGDCTAPAMVVKAGAVVLGGYWKIGSNDE